MNRVEWTRNQVLKGEIDNFVKLSEVLKSLKRHLGLLTSFQFLATRKLYELNLLTILGYFLVRWTEILKSKDKQLAHLQGVDLFKARHLRVCLKELAEQNHLAGPSHESLFRSRANEVQETCFRQGALT